MKGKPLYKKIAGKITYEIQNKMKANDKLLSENEMIKKYEVSRNTIRLALSELEKHGYIYRKQGKGAFVKSSFTTGVKLGTDYSFTNQMKAMGKTPHTKILNINLSKSNEEISNYLELENNENVYEIKRLRLANDTPMLLETTYLPVKVFPDLSIDDLASKPMYSVFHDKYGEDFDHAFENIYARTLTLEEATLLKIKNDFSCLLLQRCSYDQYNRPIEYTLSKARADKFVYTVKYEKDD